MIINGTLDLSNCKELKDISKIPGGLTFEKIFQKSNVCLEKI